MFESKIITNIEKRLMDIRAKEIWNERHPDNPVKKGECIHHRNRNKRDNSRKNQQKLKTWDHAFIHYLAQKRKKYALEQKGPYCRGGD